MIWRNKMRNRGWRRKKDFSKAKRKNNIDKELIRPTNWHYILCYNNLHEYSKNKIHCSCAMCSAKTRNKGKRRMISKNYSPSVNYTIKDQRRKDEMDYEEKWN